MDRGPEGVTGNRVDTDSGAEAGYRLFLPKFMAIGDLIEKGLLFLPSFMTVGGWAWFPPVSVFKSCCPHPRESPMVLALLMSVAFGTTILPYPNTSQCQEVFRVQFHKFKTDFKALFCRIIMLHKHNITPRASN